MWVQMEQSGYHTQSFLIVEEFLISLSSHSSMSRMPGCMCVHACLCMDVFVCSVPVLGFGSRTATDGYVVLGQIQLTQSPEFDFISAPLEG